MFDKFIASWETFHERLLNGIMKTNRAFCLWNARPLAANHGSQFRSPHNGHLDLRNRTLAAAAHTQRMGLITAWLFCVWNQWELGERLVVCQGRQRLPRLIKAWLELRGEAFTQAGVERYLRTDLDRIIMRASSFHKHVISSVSAWAGTPLLFS